MNRTLLKLGTIAVAGWAARKYIRQRSGDDLYDRVVLITGSSRGLGLATAHEFAREGCRVVLTARNAEQLEIARREVSQYGTDVIAIPCDIQDRDQVKDLVRQATEHFGRIDILVNNAGTIIMGPLEVQNEDDFRTAMETMFWGPYYTTMAVLPQMMARNEGRIMNVSSIGGVIGAPHLLSYSAAKFAVAGFSEGLHAELRRHGIKVTTVIPGFMRTGSHRNAIFKGKHREEYRLFSLGASLPLLSTTAESAARQIVDAARHGDAALLITPYVRIAMMANAISPGLTSFIAGTAARFMPTAGGIGEEGRLGRESEGAVSNSFLTALGRRAAREYQHQEAH